MTTLNILLIIIAILAIIIAIMIIVDYVVNAKLQGYFAFTKAWIQDILNNYMGDDDD